MGEFSHLNHSREVFRLAVHVRQRSITVLGESREKVKITLSVACGNVQTRHAGGVYGKNRQITAVTRFLSEEMCQQVATMLESTFGRSHTPTVQRIHDSTLQRIGWECNGTDNAAFNLHPFFIVPIHRCTLGTTSVPCDAISQSIISPLLIKVLTRALFQQS